MAAFLTSIGTFITAFLGGIGDWATMAASNNLLLLFLGISIAGGLLALLIHFVKGV